MKYLLFIISFLIFVNHPSLFAQTGFGAPDTVCTQALFAPTINPAITANTYFWHFCSSNVSNAPSGVNIGNIGNLNGPAFITIAQDSGNYYAFIINYEFTIYQVKINLVRYRFGNSLLNTPQADSLGNFGGVIPKNIEGIQVKKDKGKWYGFMVGGLDDNTKLIRIDFGNSLQNSPTAKNLTNIGNMANPVDLNLLEENGHWIGFTVNSANNTITRFEFDSLASTPTGVNLGNIGNLNEPRGICTFPQNGNWYMFITNYNSNSLSRLTFTGSLLNMPTGINLGTSTQLDLPFDLVLIRSCDEPYGFVVNHYDNSIVRIDFPNGIDKNITYSSFGNVGQLYHPNGISDVYRENDQTFAFVANIDNNTISRIYFQTCTEPSILTSSVSNPPQLSYAHGGIYNISLLLDQNLSTERLYCKPILVVEKPILNWPKDTTVCPDKPIALKAGSGFAHYLWQDGSKDSTLKAIDAGIYWVQVSNTKNCEAGDTITISHFPDDLFLGNDTSYTIGHSIILNAGNNYRSYDWSTGEKNLPTIKVIKPGTYAVTVTDVNSCIFTDTILIKLQVQLPNFFTPNGDGINDIWKPLLFNHYPEADVKIYDRYGKLIASYRGNDRGWDGTYNGRLADPDTYWYVVDLKNEIKPLTGQITIKR